MTACLVPECNTATVLYQKRENGRITCRLDNIRTNICTSVSSIANRQKGKIYISGRDTELWIYNQFSIKLRNMIKNKKVNCKMVGDVHFTLKSPDAGHSQVDGATGLVAIAQEEGRRGTGTSGSVLTPTLLPYAPDPGT